MNKKEYRKPIFKPVAIEGSSLLAGSLEGDTTEQIDYSGNDSGSGTADSNFSFWDDEELSSF